MASGKPCISQCFQLVYLTNFPCCKLGVREPEHSELMEALKVLKAIRHANRMGVEYRKMARDIRDERAFNQSKLIVNVLSINVAAILVYMFGLSVGDTNELNKSTKSDCTDSI